MDQYKLGISLIYTSVDILDQMESIKNVGFDAFFTPWIPERTEEIANKAAKVGLSQQSIHAPFSGDHKVRYLWEGGEAGEFTTNALIECVRDCARFDIPVMVLHPYAGYKDRLPMEKGLDNYARIVEEANKLGVTLGFENVEGEEYLAALMKRFWNEPSCGFCLDTGHEMCYNEHRDMLALYGEKLVHTHFNDNLGVRGNEITTKDDLHLLPTDGIADWHNTMERIKKANYNGILMSEVAYADREGKDGILLDYGQKSLEEYLTMAYKKIKKAVSM